MSAIQHFDPNYGVTKQFIREECVKLSLHIKIPTWSLTVDREVNASKKQKRNTLVKPMEVCPLSKYRQRARKLLLLRGIAFDGGYLVKKVDLEEVSKELLGFGKEFNAEIDGALQQFDAELTELGKQLSEEERDRLMKAFIDRGGVHGYKKDIAFKFSAYNISPAAEGDEEMDAFTDEVHGLLGTLCHEVHEIWKTRPSFSDKKLSRVAHQRFLENILRKLETLAFLAPAKISPLCETIRSAIPLLDKKDIADIDKLTIGGLYDVLGDVKKVLMGAESALDLTFDDVAEENSAATEANESWVKDAVSVATTSSDAGNGGEQSAIDLLFGDEEPSLPATSTANTLPEVKEANEKEEAAIPEETAPKASRSVFDDRPVMEW